MQYDSRGGELLTPIKTSLIHVFCELQRQAGEFALQLQAEDAAAAAAEGAMAATVAAVRAATAACVRCAAELAELTEAELAAFGEAADGPVVAEAETEACAMATALPARASAK